MELHKILKKYLKKKQISQKGYSLRVLAKQLKVSPSFLSRMLNGKKAVPQKILLELRKYLNIEDEVFGSLLPANAEIAKEKIKRPIDTQLKDWDFADKKSISILRQWFYLPILEFTTLKNYDGRVESICERLGLSKTSVEIALNEMETLGLLEKKDQKYKKTKKKIRWASSNSEIEIRGFHSQMLGKAQMELNNVDTESFKRRLITGVTITTSEEKILSAKTKLMECLHEIANDLIDDNGTEIYQLALQFFPLTQKEEPNF